MVGLMKHKSRGTARALSIAAIIRALASFAVSRVVNTAAVTAIGSAFKGVDTANIGARAPATSAHPSKSALHLRGLLGHVRGRALGPRTSCSATMRSAIWLCRHTRAASQVSTHRHHVEVCVGQEGFDTTVNQVEAVVAGRRQPDQPVGSFFALQAR